MKNPWEQPEVSIPLIMNNWRALNTVLREAFATRQAAKVELPMKEAMELFLELLYWSNQMPVQKSLDHESLRFKPINVNERLQFIQSRPKLFHSYIQLSELIDEQEKQFVKRLAIKKASKQKFV